MPEVALEKRPNPKQLLMAILKPVTLEEAGGDSELQTLLSRARYLLLQALCSKEVGSRVSTFAKMLRFKQIGGGFKEQLTIFLFPSGRSTSVEKVDTWCYYLWCLVINCELKIDEEGVCRIPEDLENFPDDIFQLPDDISNISDSCSCPPENPLCIKHIVDSGLNLKYIEEAGLRDGAIIEFVSKGGNNFTFTLMLQTERRKNEVVTVGCSLIPDGGYNETTFILYENEWREQK